MIDNSDLILPLLNFTKKGDFYFIQILKRRKDNPEMDKDMHLIDNFFIYSPENYIKKLDRIKYICMATNSRAYIRLNKRNDEKVALQNLRLLAENISQKNYDVKNCYLSSCGQYHSDENKTWLIDIDNSEENIVTLYNLIKIEVFIEHLRPEGNKNIAIIPTKNGYHFITKPFQLDLFMKEFPNISVHKDNPTILFIP